MRRIQIVFANIPITRALVGCGCGSKGKTMARFWVFATMAVMLALAGLASLTEDRAASAAPTTVAPAMLSASSEDAPTVVEARASRRAYERRHQRVASSEAAPRGTEEGVRDTQIAASATTAIDDSAADAWSPPKYVATEAPPRRVRKPIRQKETRLTRHVGGSRESLQRKHLANYRIQPAPRRKVPRRLASNELTAGPARGEGT